MNDHHYAVIVGIDQYPKFKSLEHAKEDATDFRDWVINNDGGGLPPGQAHLILADLPRGATREQAQPTKERIWAALEACKDASHRHLEAVPGDFSRTRLYFFVAGHGIAPKALDAALLAANASPNHLNEHISAVSLLEYLTRVQHFSEVVVFADCCRTEERHVQQMPVPWTEDSKDRGGVTRYFATGAQFFEQSFEKTNGKKEEQRGYFTSALLAGLKGQALDSTPGAPAASVDSDRLRDFITGHMYRNSMGKFSTGPLRPDIPIGGNRRIYFGPPRLRPPPAKYLVRIRVKDPSISALQIIDGTPNGVPIQTRRNGTESLFECDLPAELWEVVPITGDPPMAQSRGWMLPVKEGGGNFEF